METGILVIGSKGQLGRELLQLFPGAIGTSYTKDSRYHLDLTDSEEISRVIRSTKPKIIINAAAMTGVDACEVDIRRAMAINGKALRYITESARKIDAFLVHISTDYIFDGKEGDYNEASTPNPLNYYGISKLVGETFAESYDNSMIVRTSGIFGGSSNFPVFVIKNLKEGKPVPVIDGYYSPIHSRILAKCLLKLIEEEYHGVINVAGERVSRRDFAIKLSRSFDLDSHLLRWVDRIDTFRAIRPFDSSLNITLAKQLIGSDFFSLDANLAELRVNHAN